MNFSWKLRESCSQKWSWKIMEKSWNFVSKFLWEPRLYTLIKGSCFHLGKNGNLENVLIFTENIFGNSWEPIYKTLTLCSYFSIKRPHGSRSPSENKPSSVNHDLHKKVWSNRSQRSIAVLLLPPRMQVGPWGKFIHVVCQWISHWNTRVWDVIRTAESRWQANGNYFVKCLSKFLSFESSPWTNG